MERVQKKFPPRGSSLHAIGHLPCPLSVLPIALAIQFLGELKWEHDGAVMEDPAGKRHAQGHPG